jgi:hypothetical protein
MDIVESILATGIIDPGKSCTLPAAPGNAAAIPAVLPRKAALT